MWKPGTAKPPPSKEVATPAKPPSKKLSSGTMGMRFMQRARAVSQPKQQQQTPSIATEVDKGSSPAPPSLNGTTTNGASSSNDEQMMDEDEITTTSTAAACDMYGTQYIGRRSFGRFNPTVYQNWKDSMQQQDKQQERTKLPKVSDEELVQRYQQYVKGRGDRSGGLEATTKHDPVGNLTGKLKNKKRKPVARDANSKGSKRYKS